MDERCEKGLNHIPNQTVIHVRISMNQNITKGDDSLVIADAVNRPFVRSRQLRHRLADNLKLPFDGGPQHGIALIVRQRLADNELSHQFGSMKNIEEILSGFNLNSAVGWRSRPF